MTVRHRCATVAGDEDKCRITIEYARRFQSVFGAWTVPLRRRLRCPNRPSFLRVNGRLTRHISDEARSPPAAVHSTLDTAIPNMSIVDAPYAPAQRLLF